MSTERKIARANAILRDLDGLFPNKIQTAYGLRDTEGTPQRFKWCQARDLVTLLPELDDSGEFKYDWICPCGVDKRVHEPTCTGLSYPRTRFKQEYVLGPIMDDPKFTTAWFLCRWLAPPSIDDWIASMASEADYPANGRYVPVSRGVNYVYSMDVPDAAISEQVAQFIRQHAENWKQDLQQMKTESRKRMVPRYDAKMNVIEPADPTSPFHRVKDQIRDAMTVGGHTPGAKDDVAIFTEPLKKPEKESVNAN